MAILKNLIRRVVLTNHAGTIWFKNDIIAKISISQNHELWRSTQDNIQTYFRDVLGIILSTYNSLFWDILMNAIFESDRPRVQRCFVDLFVSFPDFFMKKSQGVNFAESAIAIYQHHNKHHFASSHHQKCQSSYT